MHGILEGFPPTGLEGWWQLCVCVGGGGGGTGSCTRGLVGLVAVHHKLTSRCSHTTSFMRHTERLSRHPSPGHIPQGAHVGQLLPPVDGFDHLVPQRGQHAREGAAQLRKLAQQLRHKRQTESPVSAHTFHKYSPRQPFPAPRSPRGTTPTTHHPAPAPGLHPPTASRGPHLARHRRAQLVGLLLPRRRARQRADPLAALQRLRQLHLGVQRKALILVAGGQVGGDVAGLGGKGSDPRVGGATSLKVRGRWCVML